MRYLMWAPREEIKVFEVFTEEEKIHLESDECPFACFDVTGEKQFEDRIKKEKDEAYNSL